MYNNQHMNQDIVRLLEIELAKQNGKTTSAGAEFNLAELENALRQLASTSSLISAWEPSAQGVGRRWKIRVFSKLKNLMVNMLNPYARKQEQYNILMAKALIELLKKQQ